MIKLSKIIKEYSKLAFAEHEEYFYHETLQEHLSSIAKEGLIPSSYGQFFVQEDASLITPEEYKERVKQEIEEELEMELAELSEEEADELINERLSEAISQIPKNDLIKRTYIWIHEPISLNYGDVLLRFSKAKAKLANSKKLGDVDPFITNSISPEDLEVKTNEGWKPLLGF